MSQPPHNNVWPPCKPLNNGDCDSLHVIYRCAAGHISFAKELVRCGMKGCELSVDAISDADIEWFYRISPDGLAINEKDLHMILDDKNMPKEVKEMIMQTFPHAKKKGFRFW